jgi:hypothetical protein
MRCLVIEGRNALMLAEVGLGAMDVAAPLRRLGARRALRVRNTNIRPLRALLVDAGYRPDDVTDVFVSRLDAGLSGGLFDFPRARVHTWATEHSVETEALRKWLPRPDQLVFPRGSGALWNGFEAHPFYFEALECQLLLLPGFGRDRCALALPSEAGWLVFLGSAVLDANEVLPSTLRHRLLDTLRSEAPFSRLVTEQRFERLLKNPRCRAAVLSSFGARPPLLGCATAPLVLPEL